MRAQLAGRRRPHARRQLRRVRSPLPQAVENLTELKTPGQRFCTSCVKTVHYCQTRKEIVDRAIAGDCIAIDTGILKHEFDEAHREGVRARSFESITMGIVDFVEEPGDGTGMGREESA